MTASVYDRAIAREATIWNPFEFNGGFNATHTTERVTLFGIYANAYLNGHTYLREIETEELELLLNDYNANMAKLTQEEASTVLEIAAKRYIETIEMQIHDEQMKTRQEEIDALNDEYDAKIDALDADYEALETKRQEVELARDRMGQRIKELQMQAQLETVNQELIDVDILEQQLRSARADLDVLNAQLAGLDIQLAIAGVALDKTNTELQITEAGNEADQVAIRVSETEVQEAEVDLDIVNAGVDVTKAEVRGEEIKRNTQDVSVRVAETEVETKETEAKEYQYDAEIGNIEADTAKLALVDSELTLEQAEKSMEQTQLSILENEALLIQGRKTNVESEQEYVEKYEDTQESLDAKQLEHDQTEHDSRMTISGLERAHDEAMKDKKVQLMEGDKRDLIDDMRALKFDKAKDETKLWNIEAVVAEAYKEAAIQAAKLIAGANLITELTHTLGEGATLEPTTQSWSPYYLSGE